MADQDETVENHPSYGLVQFNRTSSSGKLFASSLNNHFNTIRLRIYDGVDYIRSDHGDRFYAKNTPFVEVELSAAQFAELVTTMNVGFGTPCTIRRKGKEQIPSPPEVQQEAGRVRGTFAKRMQKSADALMKHADELHTYLEKNNVAKKHWGPLLAPIRQMLQEVGANSPYWMECFEEATEKVVAAAKAEVDAFTTAAVQRAGLKALYEQEQARAELPAHEEIDEKTE